MEIERVERIVIRQYINENMHWLVLTPDIDYQIACFKNTALFAVKKLDFVVDRTKKLILLHYFGKRVFRYFYNS